MADKLSDETLSILDKLEAEIQADMRTYGHYVKAYDDNPTESAAAWNNSRRAVIRMINKHRDAGREPVKTTRRATLVQRFMDDTGYTDICHEYLGVRKDHMGKGRLDWYFNNPSKMLNDFVKWLVSSGHVEIKK